MNLWLNGALLTLALGLALLAIRARSLVTGVVVLGAYGFVLALVWANLGAVDVSFTEAVVGAGVSMVVLLEALRRTGAHEAAPRAARFQWFGALALIALGVPLLMAKEYIPAFGSASSPASTHVSPRYLEEAYDATHTPNVVTAVLGDYRSYDTFLEVTVVFTAALAVLLILGFGAARPVTAAALERGARQGSVVIHTAARLFMPVALIFALYVLAHGHYSPGGGFQGGVVIAASYILVALALGRARLLEMVSERTLTLLGAAGVCVYGGTGALALVMGERFLDYGAVSFLAASPADRRSLAILVIETGVAITVSAVLVLLYLRLSDGESAEGLIGDEDGEVPGSEANAAGGPPTLASAPGCARAEGSR